MTQFQVASCQLPIRKEIYNYNQNTEMTSETKLGSFSIGHWSEKRPTSLLLKDTTSEGKIEGQKRFRHNKQDISESLFSENNLGV